ILSFLHIYKGVLLSSCLSGQKCWSVTYTHQSICVFKGSTVDISCSYTYPSYHEIKTAFWFTKRESGIGPKDLSSVPGYEGHIEYLGDKESDCTLRITDLRLRDSAGYRFRFITSGEKFSGSPVSLTVTDVVLEMDPTSVSERENVTLTCRTKCTLDPITVYSWYKNGQPIPNSNTYSSVYILFSVSSEDTGRYSCSRNVTSPKASGQSYTIHNVSSEDREGYYCEALNIIGRETIPVHINVICKYDTFCPFLVLCNFTDFILTSCIYKLMTLQQCFPGFLWWGWGLS
uniref:Ig-like domain-containing protein n=1 Tax=Oncorhynchus tshawytscha TaxID=74940 RepID=A0AAZ3PDH7_ONCTS